MSHQCDLSDGLPTYGPGFDQDLQQFSEELRSQTDRGIAVLGASMLEWRIRQAIKTRIPFWDDQVKNLIGSDTSGGKLGFRDTAVLGYGLGLMGPVSLEDVKSIGEIRNKFAHHIGIRSFDDAAVSGKVDRLQTPEVGTQGVSDDLADKAGSPHVKVQRVENRRDRYIHSVNYIAWSLWSLSRQWTLRDRETPPASTLQSFKDRCFCYW